MTSFPKCAEDFFRGLNSTADTKIKYPPPIHRFSCPLSQLHSRSQSPTRFHPGFPPIYPSRSKGTCRAPWRWRAPSVWGMPSWTLSRRARRCGRRVLRWCQRSWCVCFCSSFALHVRWCPGMCGSLDINNLRDNNHINSINSIASTTSTTSTQQPNNPTRPPGNGVRFVREEDLHGQGEREPSETRDAADRGVGALHLPIAPPLCPLLLPLF